MENEVNIYWGEIEEVKEDQVSVKSRTIITDYMDVFSFDSETRVSSSLIKKGDPALVFAFGRYSIAFLGKPREKLKLDEGVFEEITFSDGSSIKIADKKLEIAGFDEVSSTSKEFKIVASKVQLGSESSLKTGVVTQQCVCAFTGAPHPQASTEVLAGK